MIVLQCASVVAPTRQILCVKNTTGAEECCREIGSLLQPRPPALERSVVIQTEAQLLATRIRHAQQPCAILLDTRDGKLHQHAARRGFLVLGKPQEGIIQHGEHLGPAIRGSSWVALPVHPASQPRGGCSRLLHLSLQSVRLSCFRGARAHVEGGSTSQPCVITSNFSSACEQRARWLQRQLKDHHSPLQVESRRTLLRVHGYSCHCVPPLSFIVPATAPPQVTARVAQKDGKTKRSAFVDISFFFRALVSLRLWYDLTVSTIARSRSRFVSDLFSIVVLRRFAFHTP